MINIDWSPYLRIARNPVARRLAGVALDPVRRAKLRSLPANIVAHDLRQGIPFPDRSADVVYHSHLLEHLDRSDAESLMAEIRRVLKPDGIQRVVVPDLEIFARAYLAHGESCLATEAEVARHDEYVAAMIEQSVRREADGTSRQAPFRRRVETRLLGDARRRGETHQWMYDRFNLEALLERSGFADVKAHRFDTSDVPGWEEYGLDADGDGAAHKADSLYMEARARH